MDSSNKREKVIKGLEWAIKDEDVRDALYVDDLDGVIETMKNALALLKAQEPVKPEWRKGYAYCGQCGYKFNWIVDLNNFCPNCGRAVKWYA